MLTTEQSMRGLDSLLNTDYLEMQYFLISLL